MCSLYKVHCILFLVYVFFCFCNFFSVVGFNLFVFFVFWGKHFSCLLIYLSNLAECLISLIWQLVFVYLSICPSLSSNLLICIFDRQYISLRFTSLIPLLPLTPLSSPLPPLRTTALHFICPPPISSLSILVLPGHQIRNKSLHTAMATLIRPGNLIINTFLEWPKDNAGFHWLLEVLFQPIKMQLASISAETTASTSANVLLWQCILNARWRPV